MVEEFPSTTFWPCKTFVQDVVNNDEQVEIVTREHNRAHRAAQENVKPVLREYFFPTMTKIAI